MSNKHPRSTAFRSSQDLLLLKTQLFESTPKDCERAIQRIFTLETRTKLPHLLISTAHLLLTLKKFESLEDDVQGEVNLRLSSTMCLIRFVNGLLDPSQQSTFAIPLNLLAKKIGLPNWFVELRHSGTHEQLPSLEMLEVGIIGAIEWVKLNYWGKIMDVVDEEQSKDDGEEEEAIDWKDAVRRYRRIRRLNINKFIKFGDSSEEGKEYWKIVEIFEKGMTNSNSDELYKTLMFQKCIINEKYKWDQLRLLFEPLFLHLLRSSFTDEFGLKLIDKLLFKVYEHDKFQTLNVQERYNDSELKQVKKWCEWFVLRQSSTVSDNKLIDILGKTQQSFNIELLGSLKEKKGLSEDSKTKIEGKIKTIECGLEKKKEQKNENVRNIDDIDVLADLENLKKRVKLNTSHPIKLFQPHESWNPKPFGCI